MIANNVENLLAESSAKTYRQGTHRCRRPQETLDRLAPHLENFGITRVANITGLDRIGIPVFVSVRPNARSITTGLGKGVDATASKVSAIMESIETDHAEFHSCVTRLESYVELRRQAVVADPEALPLSRGTQFDENLPIYWTEGFDVIQREPVWAPLELVDMNYTVPKMPGSGCFVASSNGLASRNTSAEAVLHGLCEVIERDALAFWTYSPAVRRQQRRLDLQSVDDPVCLHLLKRFEAAGVSVMVWEMTSDLGVAAFLTVIFDSSDHLSSAPAAYGMGCHPDRGIALSRALTEAAQSRLGTIAGSRESISRRDQSVPSAQALDSCRRLAKASFPGVDFHSVPSISTTTIEDDLVAVLDRVRGVGVERVVVVDLSRPQLPVSVVSTIVPGLEGAVESKKYQPGRRVRAWAA